jgi:hypothetical protein
MVREVTGREGGQCMMMMAEGGEHKHNTNTSAMLEQVGISVNSVLSITYDQYTCTPRLWLTGYSVREQILSGKSAAKHSEKLFNLIYLNKY